MLTTPCLKQREFGVHRSLFSAHCRLSLIDDRRFCCVCAGVCECQQGDVLAEGCWIDPENVTAISTVEESM